MQLPVRHKNYSYLLSFGASLPVL